MAQQQRKGGKPGKGQSSTSTFYLIIGALALAGVIALIWAAMGGGGSAATEPIELEGMDDPATLVQQAEPMTLGDPDASVKILEFSDYMCPYCGQFTSRVRPLIEENYIDEGQVYFRFYDFPLGGSHVHSFLAARAGRCAADQDRFWEYHDYLFGQQSAWSGMSNPAGTFVDYAGTLGLDEDTFEDCLESDRHADVVTANRLLGEQLGVNSTPSIFVNGRRVPNALDWSSLREEIEGQLGS